MEDLEFDRNEYRYLVDPDMPPIPHIPLHLMMLGALHISNELEQETDNNG
jgi:hypothetical protein